MCSLGGCGGGNLCAESVDDGFEIPTCGIDVDNDGVTTLQIRTMIVCITMRMLTTDHVDNTDNDDDDDDDDNDDGDDDNDDVTIDDDNDDNDDDDDATFCCQPCGRTQRFPRQS